MNRILTIAALVALAACSPQDQGSAPSNEAANTAAEAPTAETDVPSLEGSWQVAAIDGRPVAADSTMIATFKGGKVTVASGCLQRAWTYTQKRNVVSFSTNPGGSTNCGSGTTSQQETAYAALDGTTMAIFAKEGSEASLSGSGGNLTLQRR